MMIKPIETRYHGRRFRSRLEARWAVFFDAIGIKWEYEREGYDLGGGIYYLPDFWIPQVRMWAEVKPEPFNPAELEKAHRLVQHTNFPVLMLIGEPDFVNYFAMESEPWSDDAGSIDTWWDYSLVTKMIEKGEGRFPCANFLPDNQPDCWPWDYHRAVEAALSARFEHGAQPGGYAHA